MVANAPSDFVKMVTMGMRWKKESEKDIWSKKVCPLTVPRTKTRK
jgi:hypothetical protein